MNDIIKFKPTLLAISVAMASYPLLAQDNVEEYDVSPITNSSSIKESTVEESEEMIEVIEVTGLRGSILRSTLLKQHADSLIDVISSEDVGKFPDSNVIDSMQRITGIQIDRDDGGEANGFQVRGITQNRVELNGRSLTGGESETRSANLSDIPSALIESLEVIKSPTADLIEGSLGATINLKTKRPLQLKKDILNLNVKAKYGDNIDKTYGNLSAVFSKTFRDTKYGDFGILFDAAYNDNKKAGDILRVTGWGNKCDAYIKDSNGYIDRANFSVCDTTYYAPDNFVQLQSEFGSVKESLASTLQWAPNDWSEYLFEFTYIHKDQAESRDTLQVNNRISNDDFSSEDFDAGVNADGVFFGFDNVQFTDQELELVDGFGQVQNTVLPVSSFDSSVARINSLSAQGQTLETETFNFALQGKWFLNDLTIEAEATHSRSEHERHYITSVLNRYAGVITTQNNQLLRVDPGEGFRQDGSFISVDLSDDRTIDLAFQDDRLNPLSDDLSLWRMGNVQDDGWINKPEATAIKIDIDYDIDLGDITSLEFGVRGTENIFSRVARFRSSCSRNNSFGATGPNAGSFVEGVDPACEDPSVSAVDFYNENPEAFKRVDNFYTDAGVSSISSWIQHNQSFYFNDQAAWEKAFGLDEVGSVFSSTEAYKIVEDTGAVYVKANLSGDLGENFTYRGNFGVRGVYTHIDSFTTSGSEETGFTENQISNNYMEWLPSLNIAITNDIGLIRFAAAKVMVRPNFSELKSTGAFNNFTACNVYDPNDPFNDFNNPVPNTDLSAAQQQTQLAQQYFKDNGLFETGRPCPGVRSFEATVGNTKLKPYTSYNYDLSFEKYWGEGNSASVAFFYRDVNADIELQRDLFFLSVNESDQYTGIEGSGLLEGENISSIPGQEIWRVRTFVNGEESVRQGVELAYTQFFDFLPEEFNGFGISINYTYSDGSRPAPTFVDDNGDDIDFSSFGLSPKGFDEELAAANQLVSNNDISSLQLKDPFSLLPLHKLSRHSGNVSLFYDKNKINARLAANYRSKFLFGQNEINPVYQADSLRLDFSSSYKVSKNIGINFGVQNLTKEVEHRYTRYESITERSYYSDRIYTLGTNIRF